MSEREFPPQSQAEQPGSQRRMTPEPEVIRDDYRGTGQPSEVGPAYVYLASNQSSCMSGQTLHVNGGVALKTSSPDVSPAFYCAGPMARPERLSLGRIAQRSVNYACALLGRDSRSCRTLEPARYESR